MRAATPRRTCCWSATRRCERRLRAAASSSAPNVFGDFDDPRKLRPLLVFRKEIALLRRREAALRREAQLLEIDLLRRRIDPALQLVLALERAALRRHETERDAFTFRQRTQWLEAARALVVVFHEVAVDVDLVEEHFLDGLVTAGTHVRRLEVAAAKM